MSSDDLFKLLVGVPLFLFGAAAITWISNMESARFLRGIDRKIAAEIMPRYSIFDEVSGRTIEHLMPEITNIRDGCKRENRFLFFYTFLVSLASFIGGAVFMLRWP
jgi:hypothetical protein